MAAAIAMLVLVVAPASAKRHRAPAAKPHHRAQVIAGLREPALQSPANDASAQSLPTFEWAAVAHAASYQFELAADPRFGSLVQRTLSGQGSLQTHNTAATLDKAVPDGAYWWRVRALTANGSAGPWSQVRRIVKAWTEAPQITGGDGAAVSWPISPLVLRWGSVPYAVKYVVSIATDPALSNLVLGSATQPLETQGTSFVMPVSLAPGAYYWAVTPLDAEGHRGTRSRVATFQWSWPTTTATSMTDLSPGPLVPDLGVFDPMFSWNPVPGAAHYQVEVSSAEGFPEGSRWFADTTIGTSLAPMKVLANNSQYYWRVRAIDPRGDAGVWNYGAPFMKAFDDPTPSIPNLTVRDVHGTALSGVPATDTPIVTWDPVPGASRYEVQVVPYQSGHGCDWTQVANHTSSYQTETATTAWTPLGDTATPHILSYGPAAQETFTPLLAGGTQYCLQVLARSDDDAQGGQVVSAWTQINGANKPAFTYEDPKTAVVSSLEEAYIQPLSGTVTPRTPLFTWKPVAGAQGYYVVISRDTNFTNIADIGYTNVPAYAARLANEEPLKDDTTAYHWAILPAATANGSGVYTTPQEDDPQTFNKSSVPPEPIAPAGGASVSTQPTFRWSSAENARNYRLQVSQDPTFGNPIDDVTTDSTAFTSSSTYPADTVVYWRVRANDWNGQGLNWSPTQTFVRRLPIPSPTPGVTGGSDIPPLSWTPVQGAISYDMHIEQPDGTTKDFNFESPSATIVKYYGTGIWRWQVRAEFPTGLGGKVAGGYSAPQPFLLTLEPPSGARGVKTGTRLVVSWSPDPAAKQYQVEVSTTDGFLTTVDSHRTDNTSWAPNVDLTTAANRGRLFWRVAAIDQGGNVGAFASGSFGKPPPAPRCTRVKRKIKGRTVTVKRCAASAHKKSKRKHR